MCGNRSAARAAVFAVLRLAETRGLKFGDRDEILRRERIDLGAPELGDVAEAAEVAAQVAGERAHIGALAAFDLEDGAVGRAISIEVEPADLDLAAPVCRRSSPSRARS